jgi:hypothetical protein
MNTESGTDNYTGLLLAVPRTFDLLLISRLRVSPGLRSLGWPPRTA